MKSWKEQLKGRRRKLQGRREAPGEWAEAPWNKGRAASLHPACDGGWRKTLKYSVFGGRNERSGKGNKVGGSFSLNARERKDSSLGSHRTELGLVIFCVPYSSNYDTLYFVGPQTFWSGWFCVLALFFHFVSSISSIFSSLPDSSEGWSEAAIPSSNTRWKAWSLPVSSEVVK